MRQHSARPAAEVQNRADLCRVAAGGTDEPGQLGRGLTSAFRERMRAGGAGARSQPARRQR